MSFASLIPFVRGGKMGAPVLNSVSQKYYSLLFIILLLKTEGLHVRLRKALRELRNLRMDFLNIKIL